MVAAVAAFIVVFVMGVYFLRLIFLDEYLNQPLGGFLFLNIVYVLQLVLLGLFLTVFYGFVKRKVNYINYISDEVQKIEVEGFGRCIEVKGKDELTLLSESINKMSMELKQKSEKEKQIERQKNELITNVSHDLRSPLTSIMGYVDLIKTVGAKNPEQLEEYITVVERRLNGLNGMINELFEYTKLTSSEYRLNTEEADILPLIQHIIGEYEIVLQKEGLILHSQIEADEAVVLADMEKMVRVLQNLFDNVRKYSIRGSIVETKVSKNEGRLQFVISNQTDTVTKEQVSQLFHRFYKTDSARTDYTGTGLGLSIVKEIVKLHQGKVEAWLNEGRIYFFVSLPLVS